jgi:hypothetical protein
MKKLACRLGRHDWTTRVEGGENYKVCAACGKTVADLSYPRSEQELRSPPELKGGGDGQT